MSVGAEIRLHPAQLRPVCEVIAALRDGLGVEDIAARGICSAGYARELVALFRAQGCLPRVLGFGGGR